MQRKTKSPKTTESRLNIAVNGYNTAPILSKPLTFLYPLFYLAMPNCKIVKSMRVLSTAAPKALDADPVTQAVNTHNNQILSTIKYKDVFLPFFD